MEWKFFFKLLNLNRLTKWIRKLTCQFFKLSTKYFEVHNYNENCETCSRWTSRVHGTLFRSSFAIQTSPMDCSDDSWRDTFFGKQERGALWLLIYCALEKHILTYFLISSLKILRKQIVAYSTRPDNSWWCQKVEFSKCSINIINTILLNLCLYRKLL